MSVKENYMTKTSSHCRQSEQKKRTKETFAVTYQKRTWNGRCQENEEGRKATSAETHRTRAQNGFCQEHEEG